jgi:predicted nucleic acid-binding protein
MIIVADSSPFVVLVAIGHVDVLPALFQEVRIPPEVASELASPRRPEVVRAFVAAPPPWLRIQSPQFVESIEGLHAGEAAAIALAQELLADRVIIDESLGRRAATERGLRVVGTIGVLEAAAERGFIDLGHAFEEVKKTDFWVSPTFLDERLARFLERRPDQESTESKGLPPGSDGG